MTTELAPSAPVPARPLRQQSPSPAPILANRGLPLPMFVGWARAHRARIGLVLGGFGAVVAGGLALRHGPALHSAAMGLDPQVLALFIPLCVLMLAIVGLVAAMTAAGTAPTNAVRPTRHTVHHWDNQDPD